jgi:hypothetical protein
MRMSDDRLLVVVRPNAAAPENPLTRGIQMENGSASLSEEALPLREVARGSEPMEVVDPVSLGINLTALLHQARTAEEVRGG